MAIKVSSYRFCDADAFAVTIASMGLSTDVTSCALPLTATYQVTVHANTVSTENMEVFLEQGR